MYHGFRNKQFSHKLPSWNRPESGETWTLAKTRAGGFAALGNPQNRLFRRRERKPQLLLFNVARQFCSPSPDSL